MLLLVSLCVRGGAGVLSYGGRGRRPLPLGRAYGRRCCAAAPVFSASIPPREALEKAIKRLEHGLPSSSRKQRFVVEKLARSVGVPVCSTSKKSASAESEGKRELVHSFYRTDDISWQAPGRKDCIIIHETTEEGERIKITQQATW